MSEISDPVVIISLKINEGPTPKPDYMCIVVCVFYEWSFYVLKFTSYFILVIFIRNYLRCLPSSLVVSVYIVIDISIFDHPLISSDPCYKQIKLVIPHVN